MNLMTKAVERELLKAAAERTDKPTLDRKCVVKYFSPCSQATWLIVEGEKVKDDWLLYGLCYITEPELGYVSLKELEEVSLPFGLRIERDRYIDPNATVRQLAKQIGIEV